MLGHAELQQHIGMLRLRVPLNGLLLLLLLLLMLPTAILHTARPHLIRLRRSRSLAAVLGAISFTLASLTAIVLAAHSRPVPAIFAITSVALVVGVRSVRSA